MSPGSFELFGTAHLGAIAAIVLLSALLPIIARRAGERATDVFARTFAVVLVAHELFRIWLGVAVFGYPLVDRLPLHLCGVSVFLGAALLWTRNFRLYELVYFWGLAGTLQAIITPDLHYAFPHILFFTFFLSHGLVIVTLIYATFAFRISPTHGSVWRAFAATVAYAAFIFPTNFLLGTNFLFLRHKPAGASLMDWLGPWPWYIVGLAVVGVASFYLYYLPFVIGRWVRRKG